MDRIKKAVEEQQRMCINCNCVLENGEGTAYGNGEICENCLENEFSYCDHCGGRVYISDTVSDDDTIVCSEFYDEHYHRCEDCNRIIHENDVNWSCNLPYCNDCYDELDSDEEIEDYSYKPEQYSMERVNSILVLSLKLTMAENTEKMLLQSRILRITAMNTST